MDELMLCPAGGVRAVVREMRARGVTQLTMANHEGVPEQEDVQDYFAHVTLFRRNHLVVRACGLQCLRSTCCGCSRAEVRHRTLALTHPMRTTAHTPTRRALPLTAPPASRSA